MRCLICDSVDSFENVDRFRFKPTGMCICTKCGFVNYPEIVSKTKDLKEFYREEYRDVPSVQNVYAGQRKLHYHSEFLGDLFKEWKDKGHDSPVVLEIGSAFGMFLNWFKQNFPKADINGTELTLSYRRNAWHEYGIYLAEDLDASKKYDIICSYKVAEHIPNMDLELRRYVECLKDGGLIYISVPTWFGAMTNFGASGFSLEYYYHKNHVNVWTRKLFETLLKKCGLEIVKENHCFYDDTYLCRRNDELMKETPQYEDPKDILEKMGKIKEAAVAFDESRYSDAVKIWPNFPDAHVGNYESTRASVHKNGFDWINEHVVKPALDACPDSSVVRLFCAELCMRYNRWTDAIDHLGEGVKLRPNDAGALSALAQCYRHMATKSKDQDEKIKLFREAKDVSKYIKQTSLQMQPEAITWIFNDNARIPMPQEAECKT